jgi:hypothetical protein
MRKNIRYAADAKVRISSFPECRLRDISLVGCRIHSEDFLEILPSAHLVIDVMPEDSAHVKDFVLDVKSRWIRTGRGFFESGFEIDVPEKGTALEQYVAYLARKQS